MFYFDSDGKLIGKVDQQYMDAPEHSFSATIVTDQQLGELSSGCVATDNGDGTITTSKPDAVAIMEKRKERDNLIYSRYSAQEQENIIRRANASGATQTDTDALTAMNAEINPIWDEFEANGKDADFSAYYT